jgi:hypothetical protein
VGVSFVGAWSQTGAWAFLAPAILFTLFGLNWALDMVGGEAQAVAVAAPAFSPSAMSGRARLSAWRLRLGTARMSSPPFTLFLQNRPK